MFEATLDKVMAGLAIIIPGILLLRWWLVRGTGSPEDFAEHHRRELTRRYERGEIDRESYERQLDDLRD